MKIYCVFAVEYHGQSTLIGVYDSKEKAEKRMATFNIYGYDTIKITEYDLNDDIID